MFHCTDCQVFIDRSEALKGCFTAQTVRCLLTALRHSRDVSLHRLAGVY